MKGFVILWCILLLWPFYLYSMIWVEIIFTEKKILEVQYRCHGVSIDEKFLRIKHWEYYSYRVHIRYTLF